MPHVMVKHRAKVVREVLRKEFKDMVRLGVRRTAPEELSVPDRQLTESDFSFNFVECDDEDLNHDVELVFIGVHNYQGRVDRSEKISDEIQVGVADELAAGYDESLTISTTLCMGPVAHTGGATKEPFKTSL